jgi:hypothetical protein
MHRGDIAIMNDAAMPGRASSKTNSESFETYQITGIRIKI